MRSSVRLKGCGVEERWGKDSVRWLCGSGFEAVTLFREAVNSMRGPISEVATKDSRDE